MNRSILQRMLNKLDGTNARTASAISEFESGVKNLRQKLQQEISASTLEEVNLKINKLRKSIDLNPILEGVKNLETNFNDSVVSLLSDIEGKSAELKKLTTSGDSKLESQATQLTKNLSVLRETLDKTISDNRTELNLINNELGRLLASSQTYATKDELSISKEEGRNLVRLVEKKKDEEIVKVKEDVSALRKDLLSRMANMPHGGNANRNIAIGGNNSVLSKYTDINLKAGNNVTITYAKNETTKQVDITFASSGGASVGGTVRQIQTISVSSTIGTLAGTDQVYLLDQGVQIVLPTPVSDENLYTIKNISNSSILIVGTIDDDVNGVIMPVKYTSVDIISNNVSWNIT